MVDERPSDRVVGAAIHVSTVTALAVSTRFRQLERRVRTDVFNVL